MKKLTMLLAVLMVLLISHAAHAASCVEVKDGQTIIPGQPYWRTHHYFDNVTHPPQHETYPNIRLTWNHATELQGRTLLGYKVSASDEYTHGTSSDSELTRMPLYVIVGKDTNQVTMPNIASFGDPGP